MHCHFFGQEACILKLITTKIKKAGGLMKYFLCSCLILLCALTFAAKAPIKNQVQPTNILKNNGALRGGQAGDGFSLLDVRATVSKDKKIERLVLDIGNAAMQKQIGSVGYYNVELRNSRKLIIDLTQTSKSKISRDRLVKKFIQSPFIKSASLSQDPLTQNTSLILDLKKNADVKVRSVTGSKKTAQIILDLIDNKKK